MMTFRTLAALIALAAPAQAFEMPRDPDAAQFVTSNIVGTFYHELGHAMIDILQLPVLGREEDAADTLSALMIDQIWSEETASAIIQDSANAYILYDADSAEYGNDPPYWDVHGLDLQRYYNLICLFYGADPDQRADLAESFELPPERAEQCPDEFAQAEASWGDLLDQMAPDQGPGLSLAQGLDGNPIAAILAEEIVTVNDLYPLPERVTVNVADCGEANAFYDPSDRSITLCTEYADDLLRLWTEYE